MSTTTFREPACRVSKVPFRCGCCLADQAAGEVEVTVFHMAMIPFRPCPLLKSMSDQMRWCLDCANDFRARGIA